MFTAAIIYGIIGIGCTAYFVSKPKKHGLMLAIVALLAILIVAVPTVVSFAATTNGAERVASYHDADIFYDSENDEYFVIEENFWHPIRQHIRHEINQEKAKELVAEYKKAQAVPYVDILSD